MTLIVNGDSCEVGEETTIQDLLPEPRNGISRGMAIALNGEVVPRAEWTSVRLQAGDRIEILTAIGGG